ncbi:MAG: peptidase M15 [Acidobacteriia bacterium]|nr:peptidase M15 [Terriglobia bacterium]
MNLTDHFTLEELTASSTAIRKGIDNTPSAEIIDNLKILADGLEKVRSQVLNNLGMNIDSGFRCVALNTLIGGAANSAHTSGFAADFACAGFGNPLSICQAIQASGITFDQLIQEGTWVHLSFAPTLRRQVLTAHFADGKANYTNGLG